MRYTGLLGILALLSIAFILSNNKQKIRYKLVCWGLSLQLLFAAIILGGEILSFAALLIFFGVIIIYQFRDYVSRGTSRKKQIYRLIFVILGIVVIPGALLLIFETTLLAYFFWFALSLSIILILFGKSIHKKFALSLMLLIGYTWLVSSGTSGQQIFQMISNKVKSFLNLANLGAKFLFGNLAVEKYFNPETSAWPGFGSQFAITVLPVIIFFSSFMSILYHLGIMQKIVAKMARFMQWTLGTSGAETLSCTSNVFVGQIAAPLMIKPFLKNMTRSELLTVMLGGFATISGAVLAGYIAMGIPAVHLIAASVMSAPASLVIAKIIYPETKQPETAGHVKVPEIEEDTSNILDAAAKGVKDGLKLAANVAAMLIAFIALIGLADLLLNFADKLIDGRLLEGAYLEYETVSRMSPVSGEYQGYFPGSIKTLFGNIFKPLAWLMGVSWEQAGQVGNLLGMKLTLTEFVAYGGLSDLIQQGVLTEKAQIISTYALCGFANFASIGIQIGGISSIIPSRRQELSELALKAMFGGAIASWITACIAGILV